MKKHNIILILALVIAFSFNNITYAADAAGDKTILIILDEMKFEDIEDIFNNDNFGMGFVNLKTRKPFGDSSFYFTIAAGRKVGVKPENYKGLYKNRDGTIKVAGFEDMYKNLKKQNNNIKVDILGEKLKTKGISYIGDDSSAIIAADKSGNIKSGEIEIKYDRRWLKEKTDYHLSNSSILVLSYEIGETKYRTELLKNYIHDFRDYNILIVPKGVPEEMKHLLNQNLAPIIYVKDGGRGLLKSSSTKREGFVTLEDIFVELITTNGGNSPFAIGNKINIIEKQNSLMEAQNLFKKTINLLWIAYIFHGIVYFIQCYSAYYIYKNRKEKLSSLNFYHSFIVVNIFVTLLMGASSLHVQIILYLFINLLVTYIITLFISEKEVNTIGLFATLTYGLIIFGIFFYPEVIYNSYIGFNNLFYGARYYGFNNGIMGVLLVTSIISYFFIKDLLPNKILDNLVSLLYFSTNMLALSSNYGANTGGFLTSVILFLVIVYISFLGRNRNTRNMIILILIGILLFGFNMYFDRLSSEKSHAISFLSRVKNFGISEFIDMFKVKIKELVKLTLMPPFSIVIVAQILSLKKLLKEEKINIKAETYIILFTAVVGFILNDTGMITFIYMVHYLISLLLYEITEKPSNI
jgi:hypothetical protein